MAGLVPAIRVFTCNAHQISLDNLRLRPDDLLSEGGVVGRVF